MIHVTTVEVSKIKVDRTPPAHYKRPSREDPLMRSIIEIGQQIPIVVDGDFRLIDGFKRLEIAKIRRKPEIEVVVATTTTEICKAVQENNAVSEEIGWPSRMDSPRAYQFYVSLKPLLKTEMTERRKATKGIPRGARTTDAGYPLFRISFSRALGSESTSRSHPIIATYNAASDPNNPNRKIAQELIRQHEAGEITIHQAMRQYKNKVTGGGDFFHGEVIDVTEQRWMLRNAASKQNGVVKGLMALGPLDKDLTPEERQEIVAELKKSRGKLTRFIRLFEEQK